MEDQGNTTATQGIPEVKEKYSTDCAYSDGENPDLAALGLFLFGMAVVVSIIGVGIIECVK